MPEDTELDLTGPIPPERLGELPHGWFERGWGSDGAQPPRGEDTEKQDKERDNAEAPAP